MEEFLSPAEHEEPIFQQSGKVKYKSRWYGEVTIKRFIKMLVPRQLSNYYSVMRFIALAVITLSFIGF